MEKCIGSLVSVSESASSIVLKSRYLTDLENLQVTENKQETYELYKLHFLFVTTMNI